MFEFVFLEVVVVVVVVVELSFFFGFVIFFVNSMLFSRISWGFVGFFFWVFWIFKIVGRYKERGSVNSNLREKIKKKKKSVI